MLLSRGPGVHPGLATGILRLSLAMHEFSPRVRSPQALLFSAVQPWLPQMLIMLSKQPYAFKATTCDQMVCFKPLRLLCHLAHDYG
jgi:hypothetical protein